MELNERILHFLDKCDKVDTLQLSREFNENHQKIVGAVKSLEALEMVVSEAAKSTRWDLTEEGTLVAGKGSHEAVLYWSIPDAGIPQAEVMKTVPNAKVGFSKAMSSGWILIEKSGGPPLVKKKVDTITDTVQEHLNEIKKGIDNLPDNVRNDYKKRKLLEQVIVKSFLLSKGPQFSTTIKKLETDLTSEMLLSGAWKTLQFKPYNFDALGQPPESGNLHPLLKVRSEFREIFLEMGFTEMPTNMYVESSFWNFDALFQPQQHPARDAHDTFFVSSPATSTQFPMDYLERVKKVHSEGGYGSQGYRYSCMCNDENCPPGLPVLVADSRGAEELAAHAHDGSERAHAVQAGAADTLPAAEVEGVAAARGLALADLLATLHAFFQRLGFHKLQFKPAYNPYTEPSMEIFAFHEGVFRPEMLLPMGLPEDVNVIAWGLSLERPTMIKYGLNNIRDLVGPKVDLQMVQNNPICRLDK
ncbi:Phenylalanyl-tRNA synthetase alpha subunit [Operophtera brumata]|uniref:phenylalanine--tRNA ligase n=1 Tax=Operophtera brumata TaxID=104452 RepID=A0A0L7KN65_OPEBR|nr:Phenylalanyl-tRNA synthetase alpha subunit [Operophtera brumata]